MFGKLDQTTIVGEHAHSTVSFTPKLSLQLYVQPLISSGDYDDFKELARPHSYEFNPYGNGASSTTRQTEVVDPDGSGPASPDQHRQSRLQLPLAQRATR